MLEALFYKASKAFLSEYVHDFQESDLDVSILKGTAVLRNALLSEKKMNKALESFELPFKLKLGFIEEIELDVNSQIPLRNERNR